MALTVVDVMTAGDVEAPEGLVYHTHPRLSEAADGNSYFIKGPEQNTVVAELLGCLLAAEAGLPVPVVVAAKTPDAVYAGSKEVENAVRDVMPILRRTEQVANFSDLFDAIVVDAWLANNDRNAYNCLAVKHRDHRFRIVLIDFERSETVKGPHPIMQASAVEPRTLWPTGVLGAFLKARKPAFPPPAMCSRITTLPEARVIALFDAVEEAVGAVPWRESSVHALLSRRERIAAIMDQVWQVS